MNQTISQSDKVRKYVVENYINPARIKGDECVSVRVSNVRNAMGHRLGEYPDPTTISQALGVKKFLNEQGLKILKQYGWAGYDYEIVERSSSGLLSESINLERRVSALHETESKEDIIAKLTERIDELTQDEFENLVRSYVQSKGFSDVEVTVTLRMEI